MSGTKTQTIEELRAKLQDPRYFIERFFWIVDKDRNRVPFKLNAVQDRYYRARSNWDLILKARKEGITSLIAALWTHACLFLPNTRAVIISHEDDATQRLFAKVRYFLDNMTVGDLKFKPQLDTESRKELSFPATNSSFWIGTAGSRAFGRGDDMTHVLASEVPHWPNQELLTGVFEACTNNAYRVLESTANGIGEAFYRLWKESKDPQAESPWKRHFFSWFDDPTYRTKMPEGVTIVWTAEELKLKQDYGLDDEQLWWYRKKRAGMVDKSKIVQEYPCNDQEAFMSSGRPVLNQLRLAEMESLASPAQFVGELEDDGAGVTWKDRPEGLLKVWKMPRPREMFLIAADIAEGVQGGAYSVGKVYNRSSWECVAQWRGHLDPGAFGKTLCDMGYYWNNACLVPELNNHGWATIERIRQEQYPHLLGTKDLWPDGAMEKYGFPTNEKTRGLAFSALNNAIDGRYILEHDIVTINEMQSLIRDDKGKITAPQGCWSDCAITAAIASYALKFLTVDETYRRSDRLSAPMMVSSIVSQAGRSRTGYR